MANEWTYVHSVCTVWSYVCTVCTLQTCNCSLLIGHVCIGRYWKECCFIYGSLDKGGRKSFSHAEGGWGAQTSFEVVLTWELEVLAILMEGTKSVHPLKKGGGGHKVLPCLEEGGQKVLDPRFFHFVVPPPSPYLMSSPLCNSDNFNWLQH